MTNKATQALYQFAQTLFALKLINKHQFKAFIFMEIDETIKNFGIKYGNKIN